MSTGEEDVEDNASPPKRKKMTRNAMLFSKQNKRFANFDFKLEKETGSLLSIPYSWVRSHRKPVLESGAGPSTLDAQNTYAYWPSPNSQDERNVRSLIKNCSEPNLKTWIHLPWKLRGIYDSLAEAEEALELLCGESVTESEAERLAAVGEAAAKENHTFVVRRSVLDNNVSAKRVLTTSSNSQSHSVSKKTQPLSAGHKLHSAKSAHCAQNIVVQNSMPRTKVSEKPSKVNRSSTSQSVSTSIKTQVSAAKCKPHTARSAHASSDKSVFSRSVKNTFSAKRTSGTTAEKSASVKPVLSSPPQGELKRYKTTSGTTAEKSASEKPALSSPPQPELKRCKTMSATTTEKSASEKPALLSPPQPELKRCKTMSATTTEKSASEKPVQSTPSQPELVVKIPSEATAEILTIPVVQSVTQSSSAEPAFGPDLLNSPIPVDPQSYVSMSSMTDQPRATPNMTDARQKLINLCASTVNISGTVPTLVGRQLTVHSVDACETSDGGSCFVDALDIINSNITAHMERLTAVQDHLLTLSAVVTEIAEGLAGRKAASPVSSPRATLPILGRLKKSALTTPKDVINALGFPVRTTPEDLLAMDALFSEPDNSEHKQRRSALKAALIKSVPKPDGLRSVTAITTARGALLQLADYALWQFFCGSGGSGSSKTTALMEIVWNQTVIMRVVEASQIMET